MSTGLALPPEIWSLTLDNFRELKSQDELIYLWTTLRHVCRQFQATVEDFFETQHLPRTFLHFKPESDTSSAHKPNLRSMTPCRDEKLCRFDFAGLDPKFPARAKFIFHREQAYFPARNITSSRRANFGRITQLAGPGRLGEADRGTPGSRIGLYENTVGLSLVQIRGGLDDCAMSNLCIDPKKRVISLEWKDLFTRFFGGKMMADRILEQALPSPIEVPSSPPVVQSSIHKPMQELQLSRLKPSLQAFGRGDLETTLHDKHHAKVLLERLHRLQYPIQTWRARAEGNLGNPRMSIPNCRRRRKADQELNFDNEGNVDMMTLEAAMASGRRFDTVSQEHIQRVNTCDSCRKLDIECQGRSPYTSNPCGTCVANKVQCEGTLMQFHHDMLTLASGNYALQEYQGRLMLLEHQNKIRLLNTRARQFDASKQCSAGPSHTGVLSGNTPYSTIEGASSRAEQLQIWNAGVPAMGPYQSMGHDYSLQLKLLDQQNRQRLLQAHGHQPNANPSAGQPIQDFTTPSPKTIPRNHLSTLAAQIAPNGAGYHQPVNAAASALDSARQEHTYQLMLLEQQNKDRLLQARARPHNAFSSVGQSIDGSSGTGQPPVTLGPAVAPQSSARNIQS